MFLLTFNFLLLVLTKVCEIKCDGMSIVFMISIFHAIHKHIIVVFKCFQEFMLWLMFLEPKQVDDLSSKNQVLYNLNCC